MERDTNWEKNRDWEIISRERHKSAPRSRFKNAMCQYAEGHSAKNTCSIKKCRKFCHPGKHLLVPKKTKRRPSKIAKRLFQGKTFQKVKGVPFDQRIFFRKKIT